MPVVATGALACLLALGNSGWNPTLAAIGFITHFPSAMRRTSAPRHRSHQDAFRDLGIKWRQ
jgi:hypothetical protein